ncbi:MAG: 4-alpha-glucanotransferase [Hyphomicrobiales bacterium]|nr:MAG: 4-alpha-glucanotransferase [Hyphomicrobiales bacterium]
MTEPAASLDHLAARLGIERDYWDTTGQHHYAPDESLRAIVRSLGYAADNADDIRATLADMDAAANAGFAPGTVRTQLGGAISVPLRADSGAFEWALNLDGGETLRGTGRMENLDDAGDGRRALSFGADLPFGLHRLVIDHGEERHVSTVIVAPPTALGVGDIAGAGSRLWGVTGPLYGLRSRRNCGIGDFEDAARLAEALAPLGADFVGFNPVHALYPSEPNRTSPYSPSSRLFLNVLHIAPDMLPEFAHCEAARRYVSENAVALASLRDTRHVDYAHAARHKLALLDILYEEFKRRSGIDRARHNAFAEFRAEIGPRLHRHALFDALSEVLPPPPGGWGGFDQWPEMYRDPKSEAVARFAVENHRRVAFFEFLQWIADEQLGQASARAKEAGMALGLYLDLAVGVCGNGADAWSAPDEYAYGVSMGAPPDAFAKGGQRWALSPFNLRTLRERGYRPFAELLRSLLRHAGLARIDHVLGLNKAFWLPDGDLPGAYVKYPLDDLLAVLAIESHRANAVVIGEDLGNVPEGFREILAENNMLGCRVAYFEREWDGAFCPPETYPERVLACVGTHDLPPLRGWWKGTEIDWRGKIENKPADVIAAEQADRAIDRRRLCRMLERHDAADMPDPAAGLEDTELVDDIARRLHGRLAASPSDLVGVQIEDLLHQEDQPNLPGTTSEHPNWVRRLDVAVEDIGRDPRVTELAAIMTDGRKKP